MPGFCQGRYMGRMEDGGAPRTSADDDSCRGGLRQEVTGRVSDSLAAEPTKDSQMSCPLVRTADAIDKTGEDSLGKWHAN